MKELVKVMAELVNAQLGVIDIKTTHGSISTVVNIVVTDTVIGCTCINDREYVINIDDIKSINYIVTQ